MACGQTQCKSSPVFPVHRWGPHRTAKAAFYHHFSKDLKTLIFKGTGNCAFAVLTLGQTPPGCGHGSPGEDSRLRTLSWEPLTWKSQCLGSHSGPDTCWLCSLGQTVFLGPNFSLENGGWHNASLIVVLRGFHEPRNVKLLKWSWVKVGYYYPGFLVAGSSLVNDFRIVLLLNKPLCSPC